MAQASRLSVLVAFAALAGCANTPDRGMPDEELVQGSIEFSIERPSPEVTLLLEFQGVGECDLEFAWSSGAAAVTYLVFKIDDDDALLPTAFYASSSEPTARVHLGGVVDEGLGGAQGITQDHTLALLLNVTGGDQYAAAFGSVSTTNSTGSPVPFAMQVACAGGANPILVGSGSEFLPVTIATLTGGAGAGADPSFYGGAVQVTGQVEGIMDSATVIFRLVSIGNQAGVYRLESPQGSGLVPLSTYNNEESSGGAGTWRFELDAAMTDATFIGAIIGIQPAANG